MAFLETPSLAQSFMKLCLQCISDRNSFHEFSQISKMMVLKWEMSSQDFTSNLQVRVLFGSIGWSQQHLLQQSLIHMSCHLVLRCIAHLHLRLYIMKCSWCRWNCSSLQVRLIFVAQENLTSVNQKIKTACRAMRLRPSSSQSLAKVSLEQASLVQVSWQPSKCTPTSTMT